MAGLTSLLLGGASMAFGAYNSYQGSQQAKKGAEQAAEGARIQAEAARQAAGISKEQAAASVVFAGQERDINIAAADQSVTAAAGSRTINQGIVGEQREIEATKRQAMEVDARRQQLEIIRNQQRGRALGLTTATSQGAGKGSGLQGGYGQISGQTGVNLLGVQQNLQAGRDIFDSNSSISDFNSQMADLTYNYAVQQAGTQTAKSNLAYGYAQSNAGFQTRQADVQTLAAQGGGLVAQGQGQMQLGQSQMQLGSQLFAAGPSIFSIGQNFNQLSGGGNAFGSSGGPGYSPSPLMRWLA
jgi:hypothetical protein